MKCDNSSLTTMFVDQSTNSTTQSRGDNEEGKPLSVLNDTESADTKDMQLIYNKKRRFHHQPNKISRRNSPTMSQNMISNLNHRRDLDEDINNNNNVDKYKNDDEDIEADEDAALACHRINEKFMISSASTGHKSKLLLPPHLYKSFLASAFRQQQQQQQHNRPGSVTALDTQTELGENRQLNSSVAPPANNFNGGLHIFPRNLLFSCSAIGDRNRSPTMSCQPKSEFLRCSPTTSPPMLEVHNLIIN